MRYRIALHVFPLLQLMAFVSALILLEDHYVAAALLLFVSALMMNFSLHITIHHFVHFRPKNRWLAFFIEMLYSILLVMPFNFYKMQHFNHHRYDNKINDFTTTWKRRGDQFVPKKFFNYAFLWFIGPSMKKAISQALDEKDVNVLELRKMRFQLILIAGVYLSLFLLNPWFSLLYFLLFYLGWSLIAITNYGQHLPIEYNFTPAYTYDNRWYNFLFFNNGLHLEHHVQPHLNYPELQARKQSRVPLPHLVIGFFRKK